MQSYTEAPQDNPLANANLVLENSVGPLYHDNANGDLVESRSASKMHDYTETCKTLFVKAPEATNGKESRHADAGGQKLG